MPSPGPVIVVGAGWSGAVVARRLADAGVNVEVLERAPVVGGHSRTETLCGVVYEANGPHILHTDDARVAAFLAGLDLLDRPYRFQPLTEIELADGTPRLMSWPIQLHEITELPDWPTIRRELNALPPAPAGADFESYVVSLMGRRLYELFVEGYTRKQWGCDPSELSSSFAPKRIDLRRDGCRDLFRDGWQAFPAEQVNTAIGALLTRAAISLTCGADVTAMDIERMPDVGAVIITAPLDEFLGRPLALAWRGVHLRSTFTPTAPSGTMTAAHVINRPSLSVPYTRTIETKRATGQLVAGTVVSEEYPGADARHYPVPTVDRRYERANVGLMHEIRAMLTPTPVFFCGRLSEYLYINQDEAILRAWACADAILKKGTW